MPGIYGKGHLVH